MFLIDDLLLLPIKGMDILGTYEVRLNAKGDIVGYERKELRKRIDTGVKEE